MFDNRKAKKAFLGLKPELQSLDNELQAVERVADPVDRLVQFFNVVAPWYDKSKGPQNPVASTITALQKANSRGHHANAIQALQTLQAHFQNAGRDEYGMNRTTLGEAVTADKIYLGNVFGRWTFTASHWKNAFNKAGETAEEDKRIIEAQAATFVDSHIADMRKTIGALTTLPRV